ncbi:MAG: glycerophosphoryl diester phosphodiesterase membrane domain-containing protein, partial [Nanoarchaeota archaeon]
LLLLVISFIVIFSHLMFSPYVVLFDGKRYMAAIRRSLQLVKSKFWNVIGNTVILLLVGFAITVVLTLIFLPLLMAFQGSMASTVVLTFIQQYVSLPVSIAFVALFFAVDNAVSSESLTNGSNHVLKVMARSIRRNSLGYKKPASKSKKKVSVSKKNVKTTSSSLMRTKVDTKSVKQSPSKKTEKTTGTKTGPKKAPGKDARPSTEESKESASSSSKVIKRASRQGRRKKI